MDSWEEEYKRQVAREEELYRRKLAEIARRKAHRKKLSVLFIVILLFVAVTSAAITVSLNASDSGKDRDRDSDGAKDAPDQEKPDGSEDSADPANPEGIVIPDWITVDLLPVNEYSRPGIKLPEVNGVVVHYVGNPNTTAKQNRSYFAGLAQSHATSASSHFIVGLDGEIIMSVPLDEISYCSNNRNYDTIAIEVCHPDETGKFNDVTVESLVKLLRWLCDTYHLEREDIIRHYDVNGKICPKYYVENPEEWEALRDKVFEKPGFLDVLGGLLGF